MYFNNGLHIVEERFKNFLSGFRMINNPSGKHMNIGVLFSGGVDSSVLLEVANKYKGTFNFSIIILYISFGDFSNAAIADNLAIKAAAKYRNEIQFDTCDTGDKQSSVKTAAKQAMKKIAFSKKLDLVLTGHHIDDQLETVLFHMFRGTTVDGLAGMSYTTDWTEGEDVRVFGKPFLDVKKTEILDYARYCKLKFIQSEENYDIDVSDRNYIRNNIVPLVQHRFNQNAIIQTIDNVKKFLNEKKEPVIDVIIEQGAWPLDQFIRLPVGNRVFVVREYLYRRHGCHLESKVVSDLRKKLEDDLTELCLDLGHGFVLNRVMNSVAVEQVSKINTKA